MWLHSLGSRTVGYQRKKEESSMLRWRILRWVLPSVLGYVDVDCDRGRKTCGFQVNVESYGARAAPAGGPCSRGDCHYRCAFRSSTVSRSDGSSVGAHPWSIHHKRK